MKIKKCGIIYFNMIKYKVFKASQEKEINDFLQKNGDFLASDGLKVSDGNVAIFYSDKTEEDLENDFIIKALKDGIRQAKINLAIHTKDVHFQQGLVIAGAGDLGLKKAEKERKDDLAQIYYYTQVVDMVKKGTLIPKIENPIIKVTETKKDAKKEDKKS